MLTRERSRSRSASPSASCPGRAPGWATPARALALTAALGALPEQFALGASGDARRRAGLARLGRRPPGAARPGGSRAEVRVAGLDRAADVAVAHAALLDDAARGRSRGARLGARPCSGARRWATDAPERRRERRDHSAPRRRDAADTTKGPRSLAQIATPSRRRRPTPSRSRWPSASRSRRARSGRCSRGRRCARASVARPSRTCRRAPVCASSRDRSRARWASCRSSTARAARGSCWACSPCASTSRISAPRRGRGRPRLGVVAPQARAGPLVTTQARPASIDTGRRSRSCVDSAPARSPRYPTTLRGQFRRHMPQYLLGTVDARRLPARDEPDRLASRRRRSTHVFGADPAERVAARRDDPRARRRARSSSRVASRWYIFNAGRDVEYELRDELLRQAAPARRGVLPEDAGGRDHEPLDERPAAGPHAARLRRAQRRQRRASRSRARCRSCSASARQLTLACLLNLPLVIAHLALASRAACTRACARTRRRSAA